MVTRSENARARALSCPSAPADGPDARVFGVMSGTPEAPELAYLQEPVPMSEELRGLAGELHPGELFRTTGRCLESGCREYANGRCSLGGRVVELLPVVSESLPPCSIRSSCRWFREQGASACQRCPQVITFVPSSETAARDAQRAKRQLRVI